MEKFHINSFLNNHIITCKFILRLFAIVGILYLSLSTCIFAYKAGGDIWNFFRLGHIAPSRIGRTVAGGIGILVGLATFVQIAPIIWDRLSKWGQDIDNYFAKVTFKKDYFLDKAEDLLIGIRKAINQINSNVHRIHWQLSNDGQLAKSSKLKMQNRLESLMHKDLAEADKNYNKVIELLKNNEAFDNLNRKRKAKADEDLNLLTIQLTDSCVKVTRLINQLNTSVVPRKSTKHLETLS